MKQARGRKILIVGLGLIGGSYARGLRAAGHEVGAIDPRPGCIEYAVKEGIIDHGRNEAESEYIGRFDTVILALYPHILLDWLRIHGDKLAHGALVSDVTGVKSETVPAVSAILREDLDWVPAHPMAGREVYGVENSDAEIFKGANFIITPCGRSSAEGIESVRELAAELGFGRISTLSPEEHDEMIGFLSQLTHCIAVSLMTCKDNAHLVDYTGDSFRDLTRIARINEDMWTELFLDNRKVLLEQMDIFMEEFKRLRDALERGDAGTMKDMMRQSTVRRAAFDKIPDKFSA